ncbi:MAG: tetratricopeptide repeat protein [Bacteroidales bacterium]|nr:tetratricopeptide repeat protein [Bacteroidales bacterium]
MAKEPENTEVKKNSLKHFFTRSEEYINENQKTVSIVVGVIVGILLIYFAYKKFYLAPREIEAQSQMYSAENYFDKDSLKFALNGDGNNPGFLEIIDQYGSTKSGNLAHYYAGMCYLKLGQFQNAIDHLESFKSDDQLVKTLAIGAVGDAYLELKQTDKAIEYYTKAAERKANTLTSPYFLNKLANTYEDNNQLDKAIEIYQRLKKEYPKSFEAKEAEKYIAKIKAKTGQ